MIPYLAIQTHYSANFSVIKGIARFVSEHEYSSPFHYPMNIHPHTHLDSYKKYPVAFNRLKGVLAELMNNISGFDVLEVGAGTGRYTEHLIKTGANIHITEQSQAVEINAQIARGYSNYQAAQADVYNIPYADQTFDTVICLGHLPHVPDFEKAVEQIYLKVKPGGRLFFDSVAPSLMQLTKSSIWLRMILQKIPLQMKEKIILSIVKLFFPVHWMIRNLYPAQIVLSRISPCFFYYRDFPLIPRKIHNDITILDTVDFITQPNLHFTTLKRLQKLMDSLGANNVTIRSGGIGWEVACTKPL
jgi:2-polyprenyl-3-methyl-5-hydroxy-6-metoxy-1,4-benzoquinol methylase